MAEQKVVIGAELKLESAQSLESVGKIKQAFREAQKALQAAQEEFGEFSKEAIRAAKYAAELKDRLGDSKMFMNAFNPDAKFTAFANSLHGVTGGFSAVQGAMGLVGVESDNVQKMLLKVQSAMALSQGLNAITESKDAFKQLNVVIQNSNAFLKVNEMANKAAAFTMKAFGISVETTSTSFKVLKGAIMATGIGLLVIAISEAVSYFSELSSAAEKAAEDEKDALEQRQKYAEIGLKGETDFISRQEQLGVAKAKLQGKSDKDVFDIQQNWQQQRINSLQRYLDEVGTEGEKGVAAQKELKDAELKLQVDAMNFQTEQNKKALEEQKKKADKEKQLAEQRLKQLHEQHLREIAEAKKLNEELRKENEVNSGADEKTKELIKLDQEFTDKATVLTKGGQSLLNLEMWYRQAKQDIQLKYLREDLKSEEDARAKKEAADKEAADKRVAAHQETINKIVAASQQLAVDESMSADSRRMSLSIAQQSILTDTTISEDERTRIFQAFSEARKKIDDIEKEHKAETANSIASIADSAAELAGKQTAAGKALAVASTTISTYEAAQKAYASQIIPGDPTSAVRATIAAVAAVAAGLVRVKSILAVKVPGSSSSGHSLGVGSAPVQPSVPGNAVTTLDKNSINAIGNQAIKAFVVETDVTNNQEKIARINRAARIG